MEGLTVETCSLDGSSRQTSFLCLLPSTIGAENHDLNDSSSNVATTSSLPQLSYDSVLQQIPTSSGLINDRIDTDDETLITTKSSHHENKLCSSIRKCKPYVRRKITFSDEKSNIKRKKKSNNSVEMGNFPFKLPNKPLTAYTLFCNEKRPVVRLEHCDSTMSEILKILGKEWSTLHKTSKQKFIDLAREDLYRYQKEYSILKSSQTYQDHIKLLQQHTVEKTTLNTTSNFEHEQSDEDVLQEFFENTQLPSTSIDKTPPSEANKHIVEDIDNVNIEKSLPSLFCARCNLHFTNSFNQSEHMKSRRHLTTVKKDLHRFVLKQSYSNRPKLIVLYPVTYRNRYEQNMSDDPVISFVDSYESKSLELEILQSRSQTLKTNIHDAKSEIRQLKQQYLSVQKEISKFESDNSLKKERLQNLRHTVDLIRPKESPVIEFSTRRVIRIYID